MIDNSSLTEPPEATEPAEMEDFQDREIELPLPVVVALQERAARRQNRGPDSESTAEFHRAVGAGLRPARSQQDISLSYHSPRCAICNHPDREAIEQGFLHWESPTLLAYEYGLGQRRAVYRHARAVGLFEKRAARTRRSLEFLMEQAETVTATADSVIRAVRAYSCVSDDGRWTEPTKRVIITHEHSHASSVHIEDDRSSEDAGVLDAVQPVGEPRLNPITLARQTHGLQAQSGKQASAPIVQSEAAENGRSEGAVSPPACPELATSERRVTRHSSLPLDGSVSPLATASATLGDGHAMPSISAATPIPSTKPRKLMDTLCRALSAPISRAFSAPVSRAFSAPVRGSFLRSNSPQKEEQSPTLCREAAS